MSKLVLRPNTKEINLKSEKKKNSIVKRNKAQVTREAVRKRQMSTLPRTPILLGLEHL